MGQIDSEAKSSRRERCGSNEIRDIHATKIRI